jgi:hypothetical protein
MRIQTPFKFHKFFYFGIDTSARIGDEFLAAGIWKFYIGIYPIRRGYDLSVGICDTNGCIS